MRYFDYRTDYNLLSTTIKGYIKQLELEIKLLSQMEDDIVYQQALLIINKFKNKFPDLSDVGGIILNDLLSPDNVEYCFKYHKYPDDASSIGMEIEKEIKKLFILENDLRKRCIKKWENGLTKFDDIINGEDFMVVGHASYYLPGTPEFHNYKSNKYHKQFISCSLLSNNEFNTFNNIKILYVINVNDENYISSSSFDSVTSEVSSKLFGNVKEININGDIHYINVGYSHDYNKSVTMISTPNLIENLSIKRELEQNGELFNYENSLTNEIVLDRRNSRVYGALLLSNGCDLLLNEYLVLKNNNINFKCLNKGLYRVKHGLSNYTEKEFTEFIDSLSNIGEYLKNNNISFDILRNYYNDVVLSMQYDDVILKIIEEEFSKYVDLNSIRTNVKR